VAYLTSGDACDALGISERELRKRAKDGTITFLTADSGRRFYSVPMPDEELPYYTDGERYIFSIKGRRKPVVLTKATVQDLCSAKYEKMSHAEIATQFALPVNAVNSIFRDLGKTRTSGPWTDQDLAERSQDELVEDIIRRRERDALEKAQRIEWDRVKKVAKSFDSVTACIKAAAAGFEQPPRFDIQVGPMVQRCTVLPKAAIVMTPTDFHYDLKVDSRLSGGPVVMTSAERLDDLLQRATKLLNNTHQIHTLERVFVGCGSDWFHSDTLDGKTTRGTSVDVLGINPAAARDGAHAFFAYLETVQKMAQCVVEVIHMPGNHDTMSATWLHELCVQRYRNDPNIVVNPSIRDHVFVEYRGSALGFHHGHKAKIAKLPNLHNTLCPGDFKERLYFVGHEHHLELIEAGNVVIIKLPSLAPTDYWHEGQAWVGSRKRLAAYIIGDDGLGGTLYA
jgi:hypothetical protein